MLNVRTGCAAAAILALSLLAPRAWSAPFAYVPNSGSGSVSVIDVATRMVVDTISAGTSPQAVAVNASGTRAYVTDSGSNSVYAIDTTTDTVIATVPVGASPQGIAVNPAGDRVYVANSGSTTLSIIDATTNAVIATVWSGGIGPSGVAVDPAGSFVYVTEGTGTHVWVMSTSTNAIVAGITVPFFPGPIALDPAGTRAYVLTQTAVSVIDTSTRTVIATINPPARPSAVAVDPAGSRFYVAVLASNSLDVFDVSTNAHIGLVGGGILPNGVAIDPTGTYGFVSDFANAVSVFDTAAGTTVATIPVGTSPAGITMGPLMVPGAPSIGSAIAGNGQAAVSFTAPPSDGGAAITRYTVTCDPGAITATGTSSPITVAGLTNGVAYTCTVAATNSVGTGASSGSVGFTPLGPPGAPTIGAASAANRHASLSFSPPASDGGSAITGYIATCNPGAIGAAGAASPIAVSGLTDGVTYSCSVAAVNALGTGPSSADVTFTPYTFSGPAATGTGLIRVIVTGGGAACSLASASLIGAPPGAPPVPPTIPLSNVAFPEGLFDFRMSGCTPGSTIDVTILYPKSIAGATYWKYGPTAADPAPHWYPFPAAIAGSTAHFSITDGGLGDDDLAPDGSIADPGGPGLGLALPAVPTLSQFAQLLLGLLLGLAAFARLRGRRS